MVVTKQRSPNYPGCDLETSIAGAKALYETVSKGEFNLADTIKAWGYGSVSGPVRVRLAALRQFGLLQGKKGDNPRLSRLALTLVLRDRSSAEHLSAIKEATLTPPLFKELQDSKPDVADGALREYLILDKNFTLAGADRFIEVYRSTLRLAHIGIEDDIMSGRPEDESLREDEPDMPLPLPPPMPEGSIMIPVLFSQDKVGTVTLPVNMSTSDWKQLDRILTAYKPDNPTSEQSEIRNDGLNRANGESEESNIGPSRL